MKFLCILFNKYILHGRVFVFLFHFMVNKIILNPYIMIACSCNAYPLTPQFYIIQLRFIGVYIILYQNLSSAIIVFTPVKNSILLYRRVIVMRNCCI